MKRSLVNTAVSETGFQSIYDERRFIDRTVVRAMIRDPIVPDPNTLLCSLRLRFPDLYTPENDFAAFDVEVGRDRPPHLIYSPERVKDHRENMIAAAYGAAFDLFQFEGIDLQVPSGYEDRKKRKRFGAAELKGMYRYFCQKRMTDFINLNRIICLQPLSAW